MQNKSNGFEPWQAWVALISVIFNITFSYLCNYLLPNSLSFNEVSQRYANMFMPSPFAFSIWGIIYLSILLYAVYFLFAGQLLAGLFKVTFAPFVTLNMLSILWQTAFKYQLFGISFSIIVLMLVLALVLLHKSKSWLQKNNGKDTFSVPFSLFAAWLSLASMLNFTVLAVANNWYSIYLDQVLTSYTLLLVSFALGILFSLYYKDWIFPLVVAWGTFAIWHYNQGTQISFSYTCLLVACMLLVWSIAYAAGRYNAKKYIVLQSGKYI